MRGQKIVDSKSQENAEIQGARLQPLQQMWPFARIPETIRDLPDLFQGYGAYGRNPRRDQIELVDVFGLRVLGD
jgi:hypothetical protein